ncbi:HPP family protein, putative transporter [Planoprotostelium fungivorum]|nr:HPP family protein, putative transporter [Planoprotostelium fungivorum]
MHVINSWVRSNDTRLDIKEETHRESEEPETQTNQKREEKEKKEDDDDDRKEENGAKYISVGQHLKPSYFFSTLYKRTMAEPIPHNRYPHLPDPQFDTWQESVLGGLGAFLTLLLLAGASTQMPENPLLAASFGASVVLIFAAPQAAPSQPYQSMVGQLIGIVVAITVRTIFQFHVDWVAGPLSAGITIFVQMKLGAVHPPGGATALVFATTTQPLRWHGYIAIFLPIMCGNLIILAIGMFFNNVQRYR